MMKRTILVALCLILLMPIQVDAVEQRAAVNQPILSFSGMQISPERCEDFASGGVCVSV